MIYEWATVIIIGHINGLLEDSRVVTGEDIQLCTFVTDLII